MKRTLLMVIALRIVAIACAQNFENIRSQVRDGKIDIVFDLVSKSTTTRYDIIVRSSYNNFGAPLTRLTGDLTGVHPGSGKKITWDIANELDSFNGNLVFELQGTAVYPLVIPRPPHSLKRGRSHQVTTTGGRKEQSFEVTVLSPSGEIVNHFNTSHRSSFIVSLDKNLKKGRGYKLVVKTDGESKEYPFKVKPRVGRLWFALPVAAATAVWLLLPKPDNTLPEAPPPPAQP